MSYLLAGFLQNKIAKPSFLINGSLGGLVAITACCHCVSMPDAVAVGLIAGLVCMATDTVLLKYRIDDAAGAIPVHLG